MGRGVIVEHLGDAHYRIGLDIEVTYARNALYGLQTYLAEFAPAYQEATEKKDAAKAALTPINDRLTEYLKAGQEASQTAYDAMVAAYEEYAEAVETLPDQQTAESLLEDSEELAGEFTGDPTLETQTLSLSADLLWQAFVGDFTDPAAVQAATDAKDAAASDLVTAQEQFDNGDLPEEALTFYSNEYNRLRGEWVTAVQDNSGLGRIAVLEKAWADATDAFNTARENLGKLLNNGGMPEELAAILSDQEKAYSEYHAALANWQSMTLIKAEKEKAAAELQSRLIPFTDNDGNPIRQEVNAWCCDYTEDLAVGAPVATIEIPGERDLAVRVRPGYESRETYDAARDGLLQPSWAGSPEQTYWNWALHPGNARWSPAYRLGEILLIDRQAGTCTVQLDQQTNSPKSKTRDGTVLDVNNPIKYQIDAETGEQTAILPGDNVIVESGVTTLTDVPIEYMECGAAIFEIGDRVMVELQGRAWNSPKVIGFSESPRPCITSGILCDARVNGAGEVVQYRGAPGATYDDSKYKFIHIGEESTGGNIDWMSSDKRAVLTWHGPIGRTLTSRFWFMQYHPEDDTYQNFIGPDDDSRVLDWQIYEMRYDVPAGPDVIIPGNPNIKGGFYFLVKFKEWIYKGGQFFARAPMGHLVLGAAISESTITEEGPDNGKSVRYLIAATTLDCWDLFPLSNHPDATTLFIYAVEITSSIEDPNYPDWQLLGKQAMGGRYRLPASHIVTFSGSGKKFATLWPKFRFLSPSQTYIDSNTDPQAAQDEHTIVRGEINHEGHDLSVTFEIEEQNGVNHQGTSTVKNAVIGIDFIGDEEVTLTAHYTRQDVQVDPELPAGAWQITDSFLTMKLQDSEGHIYCDNHQNVTGITYGLPSDQIDMKGDSDVDLPIFIDIRHKEMVRINFIVDEDVRITQISGVDDPYDIRNRYVKTELALKGGEGRTLFSYSYEATDTSSYQQETFSDYGEVIFNSHGPLMHYGRTFIYDGDHLSALANDIATPVFVSPKIDNHSVEAMIDKEVADNIKLRIRVGGDKSIIDTNGNVIVNLLYQFGASVPIITGDNPFVFGYYPWFAYPLEGNAGNFLTSSMNVRAATKSNLEIDWGKHKTDQHKTPEGDPPPEEPFADALITPIALI